MRSLTLLLVITLLAGGYGRGVPKHGSKASSEDSTQSESSGSEESVTEEHIENFLRDLSDLARERHGIVRDVMSSESRDLQKRATAAKVDKVIMYNKNGKAETLSVRDVCLKAHNVVRGLHVDTEPLEWDAKLADGAASWALHLAETGQFAHAPAADRDHAGENIYTASMMVKLGGGGPRDAPVASPAAAVLAWYSESWEVNGVEKAYDYNADYNPGTGHFTQVVWRGSTRVGCGVATVEADTMQTTYVVARYEKAGNMQGAFAENVGRTRPGAARPGGLGDLQPGAGCVEIGKHCSKYAGFCDMLGDACACTCNTA